MKIPDTTAIENIVDPSTYAKSYLQFSSSIPRPRKLVQIHKDRLGKQSTTFINSRRMWVWIRPTWTVFVNNDKGICFEVPTGTGPEAAWEAWNDYIKAMALRT